MVELSEGVTCCFGSCVGSRFGNRAPIICRIVERKEGMKCDDVTQTHTQWKIKLKLYIYSNNKIIKIKME